MKKMYGWPQEEVQENMIRTVSDGKYSLNKTHQCMSPGPTECAVVMVKFLSQPGAEVLLNTQKKPNNLEIILILTEIWK